MGDRILAGYRTVGTFVGAIQLYAGEKQVVTTQGVAAAGYTFGQLNERDETFRFPVVAEVGGKLVPWNPLASDNPDDYAAGTLTLSTAVPAIGDKVTINGHDVVFKAVPVNPLDVEIGATLAETVTNAAEVVNANRGAFGVDGGVIASGAGAVLTLRSPGTAGNAVTLAKTFATAGNGTVSGATLAGGTDSDAEPGGAAVPIGILPHAMDTTAAGYNADTDTPIILEAVINFDVLLVPAGTTYQEMRAAFRHSGIVIQRLY